MVTVSVCNDTITTVTVLGFADLVTVAVGNKVDI